MKPSQSNEQHNESSTPSEASPTGEASEKLSQKTDVGSIPDHLRIARWMVLLLGLLFFVVLIGGTVRLTASGMSIPEWPIIYYGENHTKPSVLPPFFNEAAWQVAHDTYHHEYLIPNGKDDIPMAQFKREFFIEWGHRCIVSIFGIAFLAVIVQVYRNPTLRRRVGKMLGVSIAVLLTQIILGGKVVLNHTHPLYVSIHLVTAFTFISLILWMTLRLSQPEDRPLPEMTSKSLKWAWAAVAACGLQIFVGGIVAKTYAGKHFNEWPTLGGNIVPPKDVLWNSSLANPLMNFLDNIVMIQFIHRWWAFVVLALVFVLVAKLLSKPLTPGGRFALRSIFAVVVFQILLGIVTLLQAVPYSLGILHLMTGLVLFEILIFLTYEIKTNGNIALAEKAAEEKHHWEDDPENNFEAAAARVSEIN